MRKTTLAVIAVLASSFAFAGERSTSGYVKKNGTYVAPYKSTQQNKTKEDNWSTKGNENPYTGEEGSKDPYAPQK